MKNHKLILLALFILGACASGHQNTSVKLRKFVSERKFDEAIEFIRTSPLAEDQKSKLLYFCELGLLEHYRGNFAASNEQFGFAKEMIDALYTTRVSGKVSSFLSNDNADLYYGEKYEASLVYFYRALNYYTLATSETDVMKRRALLAQSRAEVVGWDSFLTEMKNERLGQALFKEDLLAKTFGALIHESQGNNTDDQVALQLYKDAQTVFFRNYNLYPTFNTAFNEFRKSFTLLPTLQEKDIVGKYVLETPHTQAFKDFLSLKIKDLSARLKSKKLSQGQVSFLIQDGMIAEKTAQKYDIPMNWGTNSGMAFTFGMGQKIHFELPTIPHVDSSKIARLEALDATGKVISDAPLTVIDPVSELAQQAINEHSTAVATKTAARVMTKHITALAASAAAYESGRRQKNGAFLMLAAIAGHAASVAAINESEKADVRFWSTLPSSIRMGSLSLPPGTYQFRAVFGTQGTPDYSVLDLGSRSVTPHALQFVMNRKDQIAPQAKIPAVSSIEIVPENRTPAGSK